MTLVQDPFTYSDGTLQSVSSGNWTAVSAGISVASNAAVTTGGSNYAEYINTNAIGDGSTELYAEADFSVNTAASFNYPGVMLTESSSSTADCYRVSNGTAGDTTAYITRVDGGTSDDIATGSNSLSSPGTMRIVWDPAGDTTITLLIDDVEILSQTDPGAGYPNPVYGGIHNYNGSAQTTYDNFEGDTVGGAAATSLILPTRTHLLRPLLVR